MTKKSQSEQTAVHQLPVYKSIQESLATALAPLVHLEIINESHMHNVPANSETHFKVIIVSEQFTDVSSLVSRHRFVHSALAGQLSGPVHALTIVAKSPQQWHVISENGKKFTPGASPPCRGGDGSL